jgi:hypothetical protein
MICLWITTDHQANRSDTFEADVQMVESDVSRPEDVARIDN